MDNKISFQDSALAFFNQSPDMFCIVSEEGWFLQLNRAWETSLGYSVEELMSKPFIEFVHPDDIEPTLKEFSAELQGKNVINFVNRYRCKNGSYKWLEWRGEADSDGKTAYAVARDISESKVSRELLWEHNLILEAISTQAKDAIIMMDPEGKISFWNNAATRIFGYTESEAIGKNLHKLLVPQRFSFEYKKNFPLFQESGKGNAIGKTLELTAIRKDGSEFTIELSLSAINIKDQWHSIGILHDISQRKQKEEAYKQQARLLDFAHDSIMVSDLHSNITYWNKGAEDTYGWTKEEVLNKNTHELLKTVFPVPLDEIKVRLLQEDFWEGELIHTTKSGTKITVASRLQLQRDSNHQPEAILEINNDITERKNAENQVRQVEARFRSAFDLPLIGFAITSPEKGWIEINSAFQKMLGYTRAELEHISWPELTHPDDLASDEREFNLILSGQSDNYLLEKRYIRKNGEIIWTIMSVACVRKADHSVDYFVALLQDITQLKNTEIALKQSEEKFRALVENIGEGVGFVNDEEQFLFANPSADKIFGVEEGTLTGRYLHDFLSPRGLAKVKSESSKRIKEKNSSYELELLLNDGSKKEILVTATASIDKKFDGTYGVFRDISEGKRIQSEIKRKNEELSHLNAEKDKFFSIIAHDLRSPFSAFMKLTQLMKDDIRSMTPEDIIQLVNALATSSTKLYDLLENLLEWSQIQSGFISPRPITFLLKPRTSSTVEVYKEQAERKNIRLTVDIPDDLTAFFDEKMYDGILRNLISNALKFTQKKGEIKIQAREFSPQFIEVSIQDTGIGMTQKMQGHLFKIDANTSRLGLEGEPSSGLGLILVKEFVDKNGGKIWVESKPDQGSKFFFTMPVKNSTSQIPLENSSSVNKLVINEIPLRILVVDDDIASRIYLSASLKKWGHQVLLGSSGLEAVNICRNTSGIDLILIDLQMPDMNGYIASQQIRQFNKNVIIIAQTTVDYHKAIDLGLEAGCNDYIQKPIDIDQLNRLIKKYFPERFSK
jgi:PAS domain S-box-containing protein